MPRANEFRELILQTCFEAVDFTNAGGSQSNNKLDIEILTRKHQELRNVVSRKLGRMALQFYPDVIVGVPNGANWLAEDVSEFVDCDVAVLRKDDQGQMAYADAHQERTVYKSSRLLIVEDVFNRFTNTRKLLQVPGIAESACGAIAVWDRGDAKNREKLAIPTPALVQEHIPDILTPDSPYWRHAR